MAGVLRSSMAKMGLSFLLTAAWCGAHAQSDTAFNYFETTEKTIRNGVQAVLTCNGLYTSNRGLDQVFAQELAYVADVLGDAKGGNYRIESDTQSVQVGGGADGPAVRAAFREGIGCVVMAPGQPLANIEELPSLPANAVDTSIMDWPMGDSVAAQSLPTAVDAAALQRASDWAFERDTKEQVTISLIVMYRGKIIHERYAAGFDRDTRTRTWSTAKSIAVTMIGMLVDAGKMSLDAPLPISWLPDVALAEEDPRAAITLRDVLQMSSGLEPVDSFGREYSTGSGLAYWAGASSVDGARWRGLIREPGRVWDYENYDTLLAVLAMKKALGDNYLHYPYRALLGPLGMENTLLSTDRFGDFILSSQVYTNARDLARFGQLYLQRGMWNGERLLSTEWIDFVTTPAPSTANRGNFYGAQFWLVDDSRTDVPKDAFATAGNRGQYVVIVPSHDVVIVRRGLDYGKQGFNRWDLTREVLKAISTQ